MHKSVSQDWPLDSSGNILDAAPADPTILDVDLFSGCFGGGPGRLPETNEIFTFNTGVMMPYQDLVFRVVGAKAPARETSAEFQLRVTQPGPPVFQIRLLLLLDTMYICS